MTQQKEINLETLKEKIERLKRLDAERTQGEWRWMMAIYADFPRDVKGQFRKAHWYEVIDAGETAMDALAATDLEKPFP